MTATKRSYQHAHDYQKVGDFLIRHHCPGNQDGNWLQPAWEYMHSHPNLDQSSLDKIGMWEENGELVALVTYESELGEAFVQIHPAYTALKPALLEHAEQNLTGANEQGVCFLRVYVNDWDMEFQQEVQGRGYRRDEDYDRPMSALAIPDPFPEIPVLPGYRVISLQDDNNLHKVHRVLWRGFNHEGEPPEEGLAWRRQMQSAPNFQPALNIVVEAPDGNFACYAGTWYEPVNRIAYVEPVATDPAYRRLGLGRAAVLEGVRRCGQLGAHTAYVGSDQLFYLALGFKKLFTIQCWIKEFN